MKKLLGSFLVFVLSFLLASQASPVFAAACNVPTTGLDETFSESRTSHTISANLSSNFSSLFYHYFKIHDGYGDGTFVAKSNRFRLDVPIDNACNSYGCLTVSDGVATFTITASSALNHSIGTGESDKYYVDIITEDGSNNDSHCDLGNYYVTNENNRNPGSGCELTVSQIRGNQTCYQTSLQDSCFSSGDRINVKVAELKTTEGVLWGSWDNSGGYEIGGLKIGQDGGAIEADSRTFAIINGEADMFFTPNSDNDSVMTIQVEERLYKNELFPGCEVTVDISSTGCNENQCNENETIIGATAARDKFSLCSQIPSADEGLRTQCRICTEGTEENEGNAGVWTAIGCIKRDPEAIITKLINVGLGLGGGVALLTFLGAGFIMSTSQGDAKRVGDAKDMMTAAVIGLIFIIFSVTMLQFVGSSILKIPGFGS